MKKLKELLSESLLQSLNVVPGQVVSNPFHTAFTPIKEEEEGEVNVGGYQTQHFDVCPGATALYKDIESKGVDMDLASRTAKLQDVLFFIEKHVEEEGYEPNPYYGEIAQILGDQIMTMAGMMDLGSEHSYIQGHIDRIQSAVQKSSVNEVKTYKKGDKLKIKLKNGKKFDVVFDSYSRTKGVALGKFKDGSGEYDTKPFDLDAIVESVNEAKNIKVTFRSIAAKNKWMKNQKLSPTDKVVVSQSDTSLVLTPDMRDYVSKTNHKDLIYQVDMVNEAKRYKGKEWSFIVDGDNIFGSINVNKTAEWKLTNVGNSLGIGGQFSLMDAGKMRGRVPFPKAGNLAQLAKRMYDMAEKETTWGVNVSENDILDGLRGYYKAWSSVK